jgi:hypothetical protein
MKNSEDITFQPYVNYRENQEYIDDFLRLTGLSYGITLQLLFKTPKEKLPSLNLLKKQFNKEVSYSMADVSVENVEMACGWITYSEYAEKAKIDEKEIENRASKGEFGKIKQHPKTGLDVIIWPPEMQEKPDEELPEPGKYRMTVTSKHEAIASIPLDVENLEDFENIQSIFLALAHSLGAQDTVTKNAEETLYKSCYLLQWIIFEVFLRGTLRELYRRHPETLNYDTTGQEKAVSYSEILDITQRFTDLNNLQVVLVEREIAKKEANDMSVHGLINFLKAAFKFKRDPYEAWYVLENNRKQTSYNRLLELKEVRNYLLHDGGIAPDDFFNCYPDVQQSENKILITEDYYHEMRLVLSAISYSLTCSIEDGEYIPQSPKNRKKG